MITDKQRIDFLQSLSDRQNYSGFCVLREPSHCCGWKLYESRERDSVYDVREAIDRVIMRQCIPKVGCFEG
jgi:hypothetical protein